MWCLSSHLLNQWPFHNKKGIQSNVIYPSARPAYSIPVYVCSTSQSKASFRPSPVIALQEYTAQNRDSNSGPLISRYYRWDVQGRSTWVISSGESAPFRSFLLQRMRTAAPISFCRWFLSFRSYLFKEHFFELLLAHIHSILVSTVDDPHNSIGLGFGVWRKCPPLRSSCSRICE